MDLIIAMDNKAYFFPSLSSEYIVEQPIRKNNNLFSIMRKVPLLYKCAYKKELLEYAEKANHIVIFDNAFNDSIVKFLKKYKEKTTLYIWNPILKTHKKNPRKWLESAIGLSHVYSFDSGDCKGFRLSYAPMLYSSNVKLPNRDIIYDIFFLGAGKDRVNILNDIANNYFQKSFRTKLIIVGNENYEIDNDAIEILDSKVSYEDYLSYFAQSKAILDIPQRGQLGNTIRTVETLFLKKKLISTNTNLIYEKFYNKQNIFIIGLDDPKTISDFLSSDYVDVPSEVLSEYSFESWVENL